MKVNQKKTETAMKTLVHNGHLGVSGLYAGKTKSQLSYYYVVLNFEYITLVLHVEEVNLIDNGNVFYPMEKKCPVINVLGKTVRSRIVIKMLHVQVCNNCINNNFTNINNIHMKLMTYFCTSRTWTLVRMDTLQSDLWWRRPHPHPHMRH